MRPVAEAIAPVDISLLTPRGGSRINAAEVTVRGTVSPANAVVLIQGRPAAVSNGVFVGTARVHRGRTRIDVIASARDATPASATVNVTRPAARRTAAKPAAARPVNVTVVTGSGGTNTCGNACGASYGGMACGGGLSVGPNTSCAFAVNVQAAYRGHGPGTVVAYSPVTRRTYAMTCVDRSPVMCTGGDRASVSFVDRAAANPAGTTACGDGLAVGRTPPARSPCGSARSTTATAREPSRPTAR